MYPNVTKVKSTIYSFIICMRSSLMPHAFLLRVIPCPINLVQLVDPRACSLAAASPRADKPAWDVLMVRNMKDHIYRFTVQDAPNLQNPIIPEQSVEDMIQKTMKGCHWAIFFPEINQRLLSLACKNWSSLQESFSPPAAERFPAFLLAFLIGGSGGCRGPAPEPLQLSQASAKTSCKLLLSGR